MDTLKLPVGKKVYFASDFHLGVPDPQKSRARELRIIEWLESIRHDSAAIFLLGDIFDTWFEYKEVVPKGYVRLLGKIAEIADSGVRIDLFTGNHDFWMKDYFQNELGTRVHFSDILLRIEEKTFNIGHGDGLGPGDHRYKALKKLLSSPISRFFYLLLHPNIGMRVASYFSQRGQKHDENHRETYKGADQEYLVRYAQDKSDEDIDYFIFGHRHIPIHYQLSSGATYYNTGDWIRYESYVEYDGTDCQLLSFRGDTSEFVHDSDG